MKLSARFLSFFLSIFIFFFLFLAPKSSVLAANLPSYSNPYLVPNVESNVPQNLHTYTQSIFISVLSTSICYLGGFDPIAPGHKCLGWDPQTGKIGYTEGGGGAIGAVTNLIAATYTPPASSIDYFKYLAGNFGIAQKAYAANCNDPSLADDDQGFGFCSISPLKSVWVATRDIVYLLLVVVFVVIGVAIMLRVHIDPRTVMTIENQIPKIIVVILLVTFSLAIAGFLIDIMYVSIFLIGNIINSLGDSSLDYAGIVRSPNPFAGIGTVIDIGDTVTQITIAMLTTIGISSPITETNTIFDAANLGILGVVLGLILYVILFLAILYTLLRVWVSLIIAYITILLDIIFAPFWFLAGLVPGASIGISAWFKDILANLAVFPAVIAMFALARKFIELTDATNGALFSPPMVSSAEPKYFGGIIAFGFIFMTPQILNTIKSAIKAPKLDLGPVLQPLGVGSRIPIQTVKEMASTHMSSKELVMKEGLKGPEWKKRGVGLATFGNILKR